MYLTVRSLSFRSNLALSGTSHGLLFNTTSSHHEIIEIVKSVSESKYEPLCGESAVVRLATYGAIPRFVMASRVYKPPCEWPKILNLVPAGYRAWICLNPMYFFPN